jgi:hypothetical protein
MTVSNNKSTEKLVLSEAATILFKNSISRKYRNNCFESKKAKYDHNQAKMLGTSAV